MSSPMSPTLVVDGKNTLTLKSEIFISSKTAFRLKGLKYPRSMTLVYNKSVSLEPIPFVSREVYPVTASSSVQTDNQNSRNSSPNLSKTKVVKALSHVKENKRMVLPPITPDYKVTLTDFDHNRMAISKV